MSQTASKPKLAMASHSVAGTELKSMRAPVFSPSSVSQTQVLISYRLGFLGQIDITTSASPKYRLSCRPFKSSLIFRGKCACFTGVKELMRVQTTEELYQFCNHARPAGLMTGAKSGAIITVEVFIKENLIFPF